MIWAGLVGGSICVLVVLGMAIGAFDAAVAPFRGGFESGTLEATQWQVDNSGGCSFDVVTQPVRTGRRSLRIKSEMGARWEVLP